MIKKIYIGIYFFLSIIFLKVLYNSIVNSFFEQDLLYFITGIYQSIKGLSFEGLIKYLFNPASNWFQMPSLNIYAFLVLKLFGPIAQYFILASVAVHFVCSFLLFSVCRKMGFDFRVSFFSAIVYLTFFAQYGAYIWPMSIIHLIVVFFILLVLNLYLKTDQLLDAGRTYGGYYILTLLINLLASFCRITIIILPIMILTHILVCSENKLVRIKKYYLWSPLFITYLLYPLIALTYVGDRKLNIILAKPDYDMRYLLFFAIGIAGLFLFGMLLHILQKSKRPNITRRIVFFGVILSFYIWLCFKDIKNVLLPYNMLIPFIGTMTSFLNPLQNALLNNSARAYCFIYLQSSIFWFLLAAFFILFFFGHIALKNRKFFIFVPWCFLSFFYLGLKNPIASRYFIYISPLFCVIFSSVTVYVLDLAFEKFRFKNFFREAILISIFVSLCVPNILAIRFDMLRNKLANNFLIYDYIKTANLIKQNISESGAKSELRPEDIYIDNIPTACSSIHNFFLKEPHSLSASPYEDCNFKFVMAQVFRNSQMVNININRVAQNKLSSKFHYTVKNGKIYKNQELNLDSFDRFFENAMQKIKEKDYKKAEDLFQKAIAKRPFLLNYLIPRLKLEDLKWVINQPDLRTWINKIDCYYKTAGSEKKRIEYLTNIMNDEIIEYIQCFFYAAYINFLLGNIEKSTELFSQIQFLDSNYERLYYTLSQISQIDSNGEMMSFLKKFDNVSLYTDVEYRNVFEFERFIFNLIFGKEVTKHKGVLVLI